MAFVCSVVGSAATQPASGAEYLYCLQVKRLHETFHEPFRKAMRQGPLSFSPTHTPAKQAGQQAQHEGQAPASDAPAAAAAVAAMPVIEMPMEFALEDPGKDEIEQDLPFL